MTLSLVTPVHAQVTSASNQSAPLNINLGPVTVLGDAPDMAGTAQPGTAPYEAPSLTPLSAGQPTSVVGQHYIDHATSPSESYDQLIALTPSVQDIQPNGPVAQQNYGESIRGFQYNQFNTTFDGIVIPGTPSTFAPQTAIYFTNHDVGSVSVDRGPGTASTIGYATFGGTVSILSKDPSQSMSITPYMTMGSYRTLLDGLDLETGAQPEANGGRGFLDVSNTSSGAALSGTSTERKNAFLKWVQPIGNNTVLTAAAMINHSYGHTPYGAQLSQIDAYGAGYGLSSNPTSQAFTGYNTDDYNTDFEYLDLISKLTPGLTLNDTVYTAGYYHHGTQGADPNGTTPNLYGDIYINGKAVNVSNDVPGLADKNDYRDWGNILRLSQTTVFGAVNAGMWFDYVSNSAYRYSADMSLDGVPYATSATGTPFSYDYTDTLRTEQPYLEAKIDLLPGLVLTAGMKYTAVTRGLDATINRSTKLPANFNETFSDVQPSAELTYAISPHWSVYGQIAEGFLAPPLNVFATTDPTNVQPETTMNYQAGTSYQGKNFTASFDGYYIPFNNYISSEQIAGTTIYSNQGGAVFQGLEAEFTHSLIDHFWLYTNGSLNDATYDNGAKVAQSPSRTGAVGLLYDRWGLFQKNDELFGFFTDKYVGPQYGLDTDMVDSFRIASYTDAAAAISYDFAVGHGHRLAFAVNMDNLFDRRGIIGFAGLAGDGVTPLYWTQPGRSVFFSVKATI